MSSKKKPSSRKSVSQRSKKTTPILKDEVVSIYGSFANLGWGNAICLRKDLTVVAFTPEESSKQKILNKELWDMYCV